MPNGPQPNLTLRRLMAEHGFTQDGLADAVNNTAERITGEPGNCTARHVRRWLSGEITWPRKASRQPMEAVFGRLATELGFRPPPGNAPARATLCKPPSAQRREVPPVLRRTFVLSLTGSVLTLPPLPEAGRLGMADLARVQAAIASLHRVDDRHGGARLADVAGRYIEYVEQAARHCTYGGRVQERLYQVLGEAADSAGWFAFDSEQQKQARQWWDTALRYATLSGDRLLQARVWSSMSNQASKLGHGREAVAIARAALDKTRGRRDGQFSALLHTRVAKGHALAGEKGACGRSLHRAEQDLDREPAEPQPWLAFFNAGELYATTCLCSMDLGDHPRAVDAARSSLEVVRSTPFRRNELSAHVRLGRSLAADGELEAAIAAGDNALKLLPAVRSPRIAVGLRTLRDDLLVCDPARAADFAERYEAVVT
jgi:tetratricopeptide (TPR) repeat protein